MKYNLRGNTGLKVSQLCLSTTTFGGRGRFQVNGELKQVSVAQLAIIFLILIGFLLTAKAQNPNIDSSRFPKPVAFTTEQDHDNMMQQLKIKKLRPGKNGNESAPDHANFDESAANPCPELPDLLTTKNGNKITTSDE